MKYPDVLGEMETMDLVAHGRSIARYGDGEFKMIRGASIKSQMFHPALSRRLAGILKSPGGFCLVGIPNIHSATPKEVFWRKQAHNADLLSPSDKYVSSFITRPDSAPWIDVPEYWSLLESLWVGHAVTLVRGSSKSLIAADLVGARQVAEIVPARQHAFAEYQSIVERVRVCGNKRVLLCLGPSATVLAFDLCAHGYHAVDLGHVGMFLHKHRRGDPMTVLEADKPQ